MGRTIPPRVDRQPGRPADRGEFPEGETMTTFVTLLELWALMLGAYGVLRESFAKVATLRPHGEGRFGEGSFGSEPAPPPDWLISFGVWVRLLPSDRQLTPTDSQRNARFAV